MITRIILLSDGTGNSDAALWRTNVWRLLDYIDQSGGHQLVYYDKGIGTTSLLSRIFGRAFGFGLPHNVLSLYKFLCQNYRKGESEIFAFGFSRGAYTIRAVLELTLSQGLVPSDVSDITMNRNVEAAYRAYRAKHFKSAFRIESVFRAVRDVFIRLTRGHYDSSQNIEVSDIAFVGLWDTVGAYGFPIEGLAKQVSHLVWPFQLATGETSPKFRSVRHALSVDDERRSFHPIMWNEVEEMSEHRIRQVWFSGEHSNLGGGNPDDSLAEISLFWMMQEAERCGLVFMRRGDVVNKLLETKDAQNPHGRIHNSRQGLGSFYRYAPRNISAFYPAGRVAKIHQSVFQRIHGRQRYAPIGIPQQYDLVMADGNVIPAKDCAIESAAQASARAHAQQAVWNLVWLRSVIYYLTIATWIYLLLFPVVHGAILDPEQSSLPPISNIVMFIGALVPSSLSLWVRAYAGNPSWLIITIGALIFFNSQGRRLETKIKDKMRAVWWGNENLDRSWFDSILLRLRTGEGVQKLGRVVQERTFAIFALGLAVFGTFVLFALLNSIIFDIRDANGGFCRSTFGRLTHVDRGAPYQLPMDLNANDLCKSTGVLVEKNVRYSLRFEAIGDWKEDGEVVRFGGIGASDLPFYRRAIRSPLSFFKRIYVRPFFTIIARTGTRGISHSFIDPVSPRRLGVVEDDFYAQQDGELFLYVNHAVLAIPGFENTFYEKNTGVAKVFIRRVN